MILLHIPVHRNRLIALAETLIISDITKPNLISVLFFSCLEESNDDEAMARNTVRHGSCESSIARATYTN